MLKHYSFEGGVKTLAILIPEKDMSIPFLTEHYVNALVAKGIKRSSVIALSVDLNDAGKAPMKLVTSCLNQIEGAVDRLNIHTLLIAEPNYFKKLCKVRTTSQAHGYPHQTMWKNVTGFLVPNYRSLYFNPDNQAKIDFTLEAVARHMLSKGGMFNVPVLQNIEYPTTPREVKQALKKLHKHDLITCDIETYHLRVDRAGVVTCAFATGEHSAVAFHVGIRDDLKQLLRNFLTSYQGTVVYHNCPFDIKVLIWELFMEHPKDYPGMLRGLHAMFKRAEDTKILAYLALNSTANPSLSLKDLAYEFAGAYGIDTTNNQHIDMPKLLEYNATDACATYWVYNKYKPLVAADKQDTIYKDIFMPAQKVITQMELTGVPMNIGKVRSIETDFLRIRNIHAKAIQKDPIIRKFNEHLRELTAKKSNAKLKKLRKTADDFIDLEFNPGSHPQVAELLHEYLKLPVLARTDTKAPSTGNKALEQLRTLVSAEKKTAYADLIGHLIELTNVNKMLDTFIPAFKKNSIDKDGWRYLHGSFNLGGTKSGRLSSSDPNLTNIPSSGTQYAKPIKKCFQTAPEAAREEPLGWLLVGADFNSLEDMISALQTKDPNKLKVYTDGYDGHALRAYKYFGDRMPDIDPNSVSSINSIAKKYPELRQDSKGPTFLLTYMGTWKGLMKQFGFSKEVAQKIEADYHELYKVSDKWVMDRLREASKSGYVELAFGLRLRTPILKQTIISSERTMPFQAHKEMKTAGNALGQSYGLLNTRAHNEFMVRVWKSRYADKIHPCMQIHDSGYYIIQNSLGCLKFVNDNLIECMQWNKLPAIQHPTIKLGGKLEVYYPSWNEAIQLPNHASMEELHNILKKY